MLTYKVYLYLPFKSLLCAHNSNRSPVYDYTIWLPGIFEVVSKKFDTDLVYFIYEDIECNVYTLIHIVLYKYI